MRSAVKWSRLLPNYLQNVQQKREALGREHDLGILANLLFSYREFDRDCNKSLGYFGNIDIKIFILGSVQFSRSVLLHSLRSHGLQDSTPPCPSATPGVHSNLRPLNWWCHQTISSSVVLFSSRLQSFPASGSLQRSQFLASGGQSSGVSASASVLPKNIQDWFSLG